jgi:hypothetical protein
MEKQIEDYLDEEYDRRMDDRADMLFEMERDRYLEEFEDE